MASVSKAIDSPVVKWIPSGKTGNQWANQETLEHFVKSIIKSYLVAESAKTDVKAALLIFDCWSVHHTDAFMQFVKDELKAEGIIARISATCQVRSRKHHGQATNAEIEAQRRLQNIYESNTFLEQIAGDAAETMKKVDSMVDGLVSSMAKDFEKSLKAAAGKIKEQFAKATLSLEKQARVAHWNVRVMAPAQPSMPPVLVGVATASVSAARGHGSFEQLELNSDEDQWHQDHTGDEDEGDDEFENAGNFGLSGSGCQIHRSWVAKSWVIDWLRFRFYCIE
ncbi:hypothetical protein BCR44DRAFT_1295320 [Catenaria anguillulae PL171]|uniref:Uncharacterized protein n=1 Tax=Catenaria anguillulae PL171 TaxID=765915 RepID=A0A1Y2HVM9_9FUNG|nr:hypothetical protein BCR44DRAFT_1295320 [Catenaria anguillulae PL171]